jgi:hypothetical protein
MGTNLVGVETNAMVEANKDLDIAGGRTDGVGLRHAEQINGGAPTDAATALVEQPNTADRQATGTPPTEANTDDHPATPPPQAVPQSTKSTVLGATSTVAIGKWEIATSLVVLLLWVSLLTAGITVGTPPFIDKIRQATIPSWQILGDFLVITICHTAPNVAMLCCLAAFLGVIGSRAVTSLDSKGTPSLDRLSSYASAITRGFFVFLILQSGAIAFSAEPFQTTTPEEYVRLAALASLISFAVGFNPLLFQDLMGRIGSIASGAPQQ